MSDTSEVLEIRAKKSAVLYISDGIGIWQNGSCGLKV